MRLPTFSDAGNMETKEQPAMWGFRSLGV